MDYNKLALEEAQKSKCKKRKVGAVIVDCVSGEVKSRGHNHLPNNITDEQGYQSCEDAMDNTKPEVVHAEIAAIKALDPIYNTRGSYIYVTHPPCENCQKAIDEAELEVKLVEQFMKFDSGKLRYGLIPPVAMKGLAEVLTYGAKKYKPNNWQQVDDTSRYVDALYRHLEAWRAGEKVDSESGLSHLKHALTNVSFLIYFEDKISNLDSRT